MAQDLRVGGVVTLKGTIKNPNGMPTDPSDVWILVLSPLSGLATYKYTLNQVTRTGTGLYETDIVLDGAGRWHYGFQVPAGVKSEDEFTVNPTAFP